jgi:hypothetical protein
MKRYHGHTFLYLHATIELGSVSSDRFASVFSDVYHPMMSVAPALRDGWEDSILQALPPSPLQ